jgi:diguanylate cyclase (GGDEF)-like protein
VVLYPREFFRKIPLAEGRAVIGRGAEADIRFDDELISRRHCEVRFDGNSFQIRDLGSTNGTFMDGQEIRDCSFEPKNRLQAGRVIFTVITEDDSENAEEAEDFRKYEESITDTLTGIPNQTQFWDRARGEFAFAERNRTPLHVLLIRPRSFEDIKKNFGESVAEKVLRELARLLDFEKHDAALLARLEDETFAMLLSGITAEEAKQEVLRLHSAMERALFSFEDTLIPVSLISGMASSLRDPKKENASIEKMVEKAKKNLEKTNAS